MLYYWTASVVVEGRRGIIRQFLNPSYFTFPSVRLYVCVTVCLCACVSVHALYYTVFITQNCQSILRLHCIARECFRFRFPISQSIKKCFSFINHHDYLFRYYLSSIVCVCMCVCVCVCVCVYVFAITAKPFNLELSNFGITFLM